jgi:hypothetical protein
MEGCEAALDPTSAQFDSVSVQGGVHELKEATQDNLRKHKVSVHGKRRKLNMQCIIVRYTCASVGMSCVHLSGPDSAPAFQRYKPMHPSELSSEIHSQIIWPIKREECAPNLECARQKSVAHVPAIALGH